MRHSLDEPFVVQVTDVARLMAQQKVAWSYQIGNVQPPNVKISKQLTFIIPPRNEEDDDHCRGGDSGGGGSGGGSGGGGSGGGGSGGSSETDDSDSDNEQSGKKRDGRKHPTESRSSTSLSSSTSSTTFGSSTTTLPTHVHGLIGTCSYELFNGICLYGGKLPRCTEQIDSCPVAVHSTTAVGSASSSNTSSLPAVFFPLPHPLTLNSRTTTLIDVSVFRTVCGSDGCYYFWDCDEDFSLEENEENDSEKEGNGKENQKTFVPFLDNDVDGLWMVEEEELNEFPNGLEA